MALNQNNSLIKFLISFITASAIALCFFINFWLVLVGFSVVMLILIGISFKNNKTIPLIADLFENNYLENRKYYEEALNNNRFFSKPYYKLKTKLYSYLIFLFKDSDQSFKALKQELLEKFKGKLNKNEFSQITESYLIQIHDEAQKRVSITSISILSGIILLAVLMPSFFPARAGVYEKTIWRTLFTEDEKKVIGYFASKQVQKELRKKDLEPDWHNIIRSYHINDGSIEGDDIEIQSVPADKIIGLDQIINNATEKFEGIGIEGILDMEYYKIINIGGNGSYFTENGGLILNDQLQVNSDIIQNGQSLDDTYINITGDVMTGYLTLSADPEAPLHAVTKQYLDTNFLGLGGGNLTGFLTLHDDPEDDMHAATKGYVDDQLGDLDLDVASLWKEVGNGDIYYDSGKVGIGTDSPKQTLDIYGSVNVASSGWAGIYLNSGRTNVGSFLAFKNSQGEVVGGFDYRDTAASQLSNVILLEARQKGIPLVFSTTSSSHSYNGIERMRIESSGNIGIATTTPTEKLTINGNTYLTGPDRYLNFGPNSGSSGYGFRDNGGTMEFRNDGGIWEPIAANYWERDYSNGYTYLANNGDKVGVGTTNPDSMIKITPGVRDGTRPEFSINDGPYSINLGYNARSLSGSIGYFSLFMNSSSVFYDTNGNHIFRTAGIEVARFTGNNYLGIGTQGPDRKLDIEDSTSPQLRLTHTDNSIYTDFQTDASGNLLITPTGGQAYINGLLVTTSDETMKKNISDLTYGLDDLMRLRPVVYDWKSNDEKDIGLIAQEVKEIIPEVVHGIEGETLGISYSHLTALAIKAIQEQQVQIAKIKVVNQVQDKSLKNLSETTRVLNRAADDNQVSLESLTALTKSQKVQIVDLELDLNDLEEEIENLESDLRKSDEDLKNLTVKVTDRIDKIESNLADNSVLNSKALTQLEKNLKILELTGGNYLFDVNGDLKVNTLYVNSLKVDANSSGKGVIKAGEEKIKIESIYVNQNSIINITSIGKKYGRDLYISKLVENQYFVVELEGEILDKDLEFNWLIVEQK
jgi:hypothetical protein